jgi:chromate reductase, NAD(P)H dehydrogenase (quinone)
VRVLAISGSLRRHSNNTRLLRALREEAPEGVDVVLWDGLKEVPPYDADDDGVPGPPAVEELRSLVRDADAVFFATPEYNSSVPGALKNALDWGSRPLATNVFRNKPVAVIGSSAGAFGGVWAAAELRKVLAAMGSRVAEVELAVGHAGDKFDDDGHLLDDDVRQGLREALDGLVAEIAPNLQAA